MTHLKITRTKDGLAIILNDEIEQLLGVAEGSEVAFAVSEEGTLVLTGLDTVADARREKGRAFIRRYQKTFEALAK